MGRLVRAVAVLGLASLLPAQLLRAANEPGIDELKARVANTKLSDRPPLCLHIAERQLDSAVSSYGAGDGAKAKAALTDVAAFAELARDYSIQSHKHEKQSEIDVRKMARRLADFKHTAAYEDQQDIQNTIDKLQRIRDDLLMAMFPKGGKK